MKIPKIENVLVIGGLALWIIETAYFGWNPKSINNVERSLDCLSMIIIGIGMILSWTNQPKITNINIKLDESFFNKLNEALNEK